MKRLTCAALFLVFAQTAFGADVMKGGQIYRVYCASCHGAGGTSTLANAPSFARGDRLMQPDQMLLASIRRGRGAMPGFFGVLTDRDTLDVIAYLRTMR